MIDRSMLLIGWLFVAWGAAQVLPITRLAFHPEAVEINGDQVTLYRTFPGDAWGLPRPRMAYVETVRPLTQAHNGGQICSDESDPFRYTRAEEIGRWSIDWAADCLSDPMGYVWSAEWSWYIGRFGVGPASLSTTVLRNGCEYRISANGIIHGPDSPHWSQTSTDRCFATRAEAEAAVE